MKDSHNYDQPVAYDANGQPLYAHPPKSDSIGRTVVHVSRSVVPEKPVITDEMRKRHEESKAQYPDLNLSETEYVIFAVRRHPIALFLPLGIGAVLIGLALSLLFNQDIILSGLLMDGQAVSSIIITLPLLLFSAFVAVFMYISYFIYINNRFTLTNESVIQGIQLSLFSRREQTISLGNVEDVSYAQSGVLQHILDYGTIRLSTQGDEHTYTFPYVSRPKLEVGILNNAVESFKNGRPVGD
jgi:hypothetical protein